MPTLSTILGEYIKDHGISKRQFAERCGISSAYAGRLVGGEMKNVSTEMIQKLAKGMNMKPAELASLINGSNSYSNVKNINEAGYKMIPLFDSISCGKGSFIDEEAEDFIPMPDRWLSPGKQYFANYAQGDSMTGEKINDGDVLVFERTDELENGEIGSFCLNEENYCKKFHQIDSEYVVLESANPAYQPIVVDLKNSDFRIIGRLKYQMSRRMR